MGIRADRLRYVFRVAADGFPLCGRGLLLASLSAVVLWLYGLRSLDLVLFVAGIAGLVLVGLSILAVGAGALRLRRWTRPGSPRSLRLEAGQTLRTGFETPALTLLPMVRVSWEWREPAIPVRLVPFGGRLLEEVKPEHRGEAQVIVRRFLIGDVFGLASLAWRTRESGPVTVLPDVGRLRGTPVVPSMAAGENIPLPHGRPEGDRMDTRPYLPGDSVRHILWKAYARTGELKVRVRERAVERARKTVAYLAAGRGDEPAAAAARVAIETGALGPGWVFGADGTSDPTSDPDQALLLIARSAGAGAPPGLPAFLEKTMARGHSHCIVFAPAVPGPWLEAALAVARRHPAALSFVLGADGIARGGPVPLWRRLLLSPPPDQGVARQDLAQVQRALAGVGCPVAVVDRTSGRAFDPRATRAAS